MSKIQIGDRIKVYDQDLEDTGTVINIDERNIVYYKIDKGSFGNEDTAHIKQCRKLVKKNTLRSRVDVVLRYCEPRTNVAWAATIVSYLLECDFKDVKQKLKEYFENKNNNGVLNK